MPPARRFLVTALLLGVPASALFPCAFGAAEEPVIMLPPLEVSAELQTMPWRYAALPGLEVLSACSEATTRSFIQAEHRLEQLFAGLVPVEFQVQLAVPKIVVLSEQKRTLSASQNLVAGFGAADAKSGKRDAGDGRTARDATVRFMPNLRLADPDMVAIFAVIDESRFEPERLGLTSDYVRFALEHRTPPLPAWLVDGLTQLSASMSFTRDAVVFAADDESTAPETAWSRLEPALPGPLLPLAELFEHSRPAEPAAAEANRPWRAQAALFVRWAFDGGGERQAAFWRFVQRASDGPITEAIFQEHFGVNYADGLSRLGEYVKQGLHDPVRVRPDRVMGVPKYALRLATEAEIGRIKGDWERLEIAHVKTHYPQYLGRYEEQATRTLTKAYASDPRDPRLLAVLGLHAADGGHNEPAREMLSAAVQGGVVRPRVYFELARLRYIEALAKPGGTDGRLAPAQVNTVLEALRGAHGQQPPLAQTYVLAAEAWARGGIRLSAEHWALLEEGMKLFPGHAGLIYHLAALKLIHGAPDEASVLIERGLQLSTSPAGRSDFEKLRATLAAAKG
jgi:hypothetical protein